MASRRSSTVWIAGQRWRIVRARLRSSYGECDYESRTIRLATGLAGSDLLDTLLHELIHARWPDIAEESVVEFAGILTSALESEGFCRPEKA